METSRIQKWNWTSAALQSPIRRRDGRLEAWKPGNPEFDEHGAKHPNYWDWSGGPPRPEYHRPDWPEGTATWFQLYETVSEGTPVTPPFETREELVEYLVAEGDFWDQKRRREGLGKSSLRCTPWTRKEAEAFVFGPGWAPTFILDKNGVHPGARG